MVSVFAEGEVFEGDTLALTYCSVDASRAHRQGNAGRYLIEEMVRPPSCATLA